MQHLKDTPRARGHAISTPALPAGAHGLVTVIDVGSLRFLIARTYRGRQGWAVHDEDGSLLVTGWPTKARAIEHAGRRAEREDARHVEDQGDALTVFPYPTPTVAAADTRGVAGNPIRVAADSIVPGMRFGRWTVESAPSPKLSGRVACRCVCGTKRNVWTGSLITGSSLSCGCYAVARSMSARKVGA